MRIFLINLDRSPDRLLQFDVEAKKIGLQYVRISAIDGCGAVPAWLADEFDRASLSSDEIVYYVSHLCVSRLVRDEGLPAAIVLEDDAVLEPTFEQCALEAVRKAPPGWDVIHMSTNFKRSAFPILELGHGHQLVRYSRLPANSAAYAISSTGALKLLQPGLRNIPIDMEFRYAWLRRLEIYGVYPALAQQRACVPSTIDGAPATAPSACNVRKRHRKPSLLSQARGRFYNLRRVGWRLKVWPPS
jgi:glycosyl transferase family 25